MRKFALYYGVLRSNGKFKTLGLGERGEIQNFKAQCKKDMSKDSVRTDYSSLVLATDYGLKNHYKLVHPDAVELAKKAQEEAAKADATAEKQAKSDAKKSLSDAKKADDDKIKADKKISDAEQVEAEARLKAAEKKATKTGSQISESDKVNKKKEEK